MLTKQEIVKMLETSDRAVARAVLVLHARQTTDEQHTGNTRYLNGRGYRPCHARMGSSMAVFFQKNGYLSPKQIAYWRVREKTGSMRIGIYAGQLLEEAINRAEQKAISTPKTPALLKIAAELDIPVIDMKLPKAETFGGVPRMVDGAATGSDTVATVDTAQGDIDAFWAQIKAKQPA